MPAKRVLVVGGGSAGWITAAYMNAVLNRGQERVVEITLVESPGSQCLGMGYLIDPVTLEHLDYREKNGYLRFSTAMAFEGEIADKGLVYIATEDNPAWLGPAPEWKIAAQIGESVGPSGRNIDYLFALSSSLRRMSADDPHIYEIESYLKQKHVAP